MEQPQAGADTESRALRNLLNGDGRVVVLLEESQGFLDAELVPSIPLCKMGIRLQSGSVFDQQAECQTETVTDMER